MHAPSWQLHRLKKTKLFKLHVLLGTWNEGEVVDLDLYNKQELVEGLIKARSSTTKERPLLSSQSNPPLSRKSAPKRSLTSSTLHSRSSTYTDEESTASETEANDGGGEETEAEPAKAARRREDLRLTRIYNAQGISSPMINRLRRARTRLPNPVADSHFGREVLTKGSTTSITSSGVSSPLGRRLRNSKSTVFAASSPARTRLRAQNMPSSSSMRHPLAANRSAVAQNVFPRRMEDRTPRQRRQKRMASKKSVAFGRYSEHETNESGEEEDNKEWEDASPTSLRRYSLNPPRQAKMRAQEQLHQLHDGLDDMSVDETPTKATLKVQPAAYTHSQPLQNDPVSDLSAEENGEEAWEEESHASETDVNASPSKMRKLRNGKIRLSTANTANQRRGEDADDDDTGALVEEEDVDMENAEDAGDVVMDVPTASSLYRLLRCQLVRLCEKHGADVAKDATKAALIETLLQTEAFQHRAPGSSRTAMPDSNSTVSSTGARRSKPAKANGKSSRRRSDKPLLLRSQSNEVQRDKPPSPIPSHGQGGAQQHLATGEDELNGLDLESLNLVDKEIPFSKLEKLEKIGSGGFKDVYIGKYQISKKTTKRVAIADIRDQLSEMDIKELTLLRDLKHENIVRFIGVCVPPPDMRMTPCMIVSELCTNGDLFDYVRNVEAPPDEEIVSLRVARTECETICAERPAPLTQFRIMLETARGLEYLHTRSPAIIHRDCKSTNVLVTRNKTAKINDFGLARVRNTKRSMIKSLVGTVNWQAVELWSPKPNYNEKVDVWSAGMTFWETLQWHQAEKKYPFQEMNEHQIYLDVGHKKLRPSTVSIRRHYGGEIVDLLDRMWDHNPKERPTMTEVCERMEELVEGKRQASQARRAAQ